MKVRDIKLYRQVQDYHEFQLPSGSPTVFRVSEKSWAIIEAPVGLERLLRGSAWRNDVVGVQPRYGGKGHQIGTNPRLT
jgi:hypothetical protein